MVRREFVRDSAAPGASATAAALAQCGTLRVVVGLFDRIFGRGRDAARARSAEVRGELARAAELYAEAGRPLEAARVMLLRGDGDPDHRARLQHYTQAAKLAPEGTPENVEARRKRALLLLALVGDVALSAVNRRDVEDAARELEAVGEHERAAEAYASIDDREGEARALTAAGDVEKLEFLLASEQHKERGQRRRRDRNAEVDLLVTSGRRREALELLDLLARESPDDATVRERVASLRARLARGPMVTFALGALGALGEERLTVAFGRELVVGRTEGTVLVPSSAVSRQHLAVTREEGGFFVRDLGSRNGTQLRGLPIRGALPVGEGLELRLGREVPVHVTPSALLAGAVQVEVPGQRVSSAFGPVVIAVGDGQWVLREGADGLIELSAKAPAAYLGDVALGDGTTLLVGDALAAERGGPARLRVVG